MPYNPKFVIEPEENVGLHSLGHHEGRQEDLCQDLPLLPKLARLRQRRRRPRSLLHQSLLLNPHAHPMAIAAVPLLLLSDLALHY